MVKGRLVAASAVAIFFLGLAGCVFTIGGSSTSNAPTKGQQLVDLKNALDHGAINQQEYDQQKAAIMSSKP